MYVLNNKTDLSFKWKLVQFVVKLRNYTDSQTGQQNTIIQKTTESRDVFRTQSNIHDGVFFKEKFYKKISSQIFDWVPNTPLKKIIKIMIYYSNFSKWNRNVWNMLLLL